MSELHIERLGGFGGFGLPGSRIRSHATLNADELAPHVRAAVYKLFEDPPPIESSDSTRDGFRYRITRKTGHIHQTIDVPESVVPTELQDRITDELL